MRKNTKITPFPKKNRDYLDELIESGAVDEMGLLDLIFIEEILNQKKRDKVG